MMSTPLSPRLARPTLSREIHAARRSAAAVMQGASRVLQSLAHWLAPAPGQPAGSAREPQLEFHAEAGAPEGALYIDGELVALLPGIRRL
jgi:hypothetical protein